MIIKKYLCIYPWKQTPFNGGINWHKNRTNPEMGECRMLKLQFCRNTMELRAMSVQKCRCFQPKHYSGRIHHLEVCTRQTKGCVSWTLSKICLSRFWVHSLHSGPRIGKYPPAWEAFAGRWTVLTEGAPWTCPTGRQNLPRRTLQRKKDAKKEAFYTRTKKTSGVLPEASQDASYSNVL